MLDITSINKLIRFIVEENDNEELALLYDDMELQRLEEFMNRMYMMENRE